MLLRKAIIWCWWIFNISICQMVSLDILTYQWCFKTFYGIQNIFPGKNLKDLSELFGSAIRCLSIEAQLIGSVKSVFLVFCAISDIGAILLSNLSSEPKLNFILFRKLLFSGRFNKMIPIWFFRKEILVAIKIKSEILVYCLSPKPV